MEPAFESAFNLTSTLNLTSALDNGTQYNPYRRPLDIAMETVLRNVSSPCFTDLPFAGLVYALFGYSLVMCLLATCGNLLVILAIVADKDLRTPFNYFLLNLNFSDLLIATVSLPISMFYHLRWTRGEFSDTSKTIVNALYFLSATASMFSLATLILDRFLAIRWPIYYRSAVSMRRYVYISIAIWLLAIATTLIYFVVNFEDYLLVLSNLAILFTLIILIFSYVGVYKRLAKQDRRFSTHDSCDSICSYASTSAAGTLASTNSSCAAITISPHRSPSHSMLNARQHRVVTSFSLVLGNFLICAVPITAMIYTLKFCGSCSCSLMRIFKEVIVLLLLTSSASNPIILALRLRCYRKALSTLLSRCILKPIKPATASLNQRT